MLTCKHVGIVLSDVEGEMRVWVLYKYKELKCEGDFICDFHSEYSSSVLLCYYE